MKFETALGERYAIERRIPRLGWKPRLHGDVGDVSLLGGNIVDDGFLGAICVVISAVIALIVLVPLLLFVAEVTVLVAIVIPLTALALIVGLKHHTVVLRDLSNDRIIDHRDARGALDSRRAARELRSAAESGAYTGARAVTEWG